MPDDMFAYAEAAAGRGLKAIIAGAGGAAHLPGMLAAKTTVPVLGVPVASRHLQGVDSLHSIVQMPKGIPVATFAIGVGGRGQRRAVRRGDAGRRRRGAAQPARGLSRRADGSGAAMTLSCNDRRTCCVRGLLIAAGRHPGRDGRRPARPHVRARRPAHGLFGAVLDPDPASPAGRCCRLPHQRRLPRRAGPGAADAALRGRSPPSSRTCRPRRWSRSARTGRSRPAPRRSPSARTARPRRRISCAAACRARRMLLIATGRAARGGAPTHLLPGILKTARLGYDGKGQVRVRDAGRARPRLGRTRRACLACWKRCCRWNARSA